MTRLEFTVLITLGMLLVSCSATTPNSKPELRFNADGTFKILQMTDIHWSDNPFKDLENEKIEKTLIELEKPDLVFLTGDTVSGGADPKILGHEWFKTVWSAVVHPMEEANVKWAWTCGNHDDEGLMTREEIAKHDSTYDLSYTQLGPAEITGATNYMLPIYPFEGDVPVANLISFDSMGYNCANVQPGYGCIGSDTVEWYRKKAYEMIDVYGHTIPSFAFFHIPLAESMFGWNSFESRGLKGESVCCASANSGLFAAAHEIGDIVATFSGHDHDNDYIVDYYNISLCYGRKTGHSSYGPLAGVQKGGRVIEFTQSPFSWKTWIREENGTIVTPDQQPQHKPTPSETQNICCRSLGGPQNPRKEMEFEH